MDQNSLCFLNLLQLLLLSLGFQLICTSRAWSSNMHITLATASPVVNRVELGFFFNFTSNGSVNKIFAILGWLTCFAIHYYTHTWFCSTYTYLFLILHLHMLYLALFIILCLVHYRSLLHFIMIFERYAFFTTSLLLGGIYWFFVHVPSCFLLSSMKGMKYI